MASKLQFIVEVNSDQARAGFQAITSALDDAGVKSKLSFGKLGEGARGAANEAMSLEGKVKALKSEMASGDRTINFFARSLNSIIPESSAAGQGIRLLADGLIGGLGLGFALQGVMAIITLFGESLKASSEAERQAAEESKKAAEARLKAWQDADRKWRELKFVQAGGTREGFEAGEATGSATGALAAARGVYENARASLARLTNSVAGAVPNEVDLAKARERLAAATAVLNMEQDRASKTVYAGVAAMEDAAGRAQDQAAERARAAAADRLKSNKSEDAAVKSRVEMQLQLAQEEANARGEIEVFAQEAAKRQEKRAEDLKEWWRQFNAEVDQETARIREKDRAEAAKKVQQYAALGQRIGESFGSALAQGMSPLKALGALLRDVARQLIQLAITSITASAGKAAGEAAASTAATPVVGPALAPAAMAAMLAMVMGLIGGLPSAAGGMMVPSDMLALIHKDERVLPARYSAGLDRLVSRGSGGGGDNYTIMAMDGASVQRVVESPDYQRAKRRADRQARRRGTV